MRRLLSFFAISSIVAGSTTAGSITDGSTTDGSITAGSTTDGSVTAGSNATGSSVLELTIPMSIPIIGHDARLGMNMGNDFTVNTEISAPIGRYESLYNMNTGGDFTKDKSTTAAASTFSARYKSLYNKNKGNEFAADTSTTVAASISITGNEALFDDIFASRNPTLLVATNESSLARPLVWLEGPLSVDAQAVLFTDTVVRGVYAYNPRKGTVKLLRNDTGELPVNEQWRRETGANGLAISRHTNTVFICQHGSHQISTIHIDHLLNKSADVPLLPLVREYNGRRLNSPNDIVIDQDASNLTHTVLYFTDPPFGWLKHGEEDGDVIDERIRANGTGNCSVYKVTVAHDTMNDPLIQRVAILYRPNGIVLHTAPNHSKRLIVSESCLGTFNPRCRGGLSRWIIFEEKSVYPGLKADVGEESDWRRVRVIEDWNLPAIGATDGMAIFKNFVISTCVGGLCVVDVNKGYVAARLTLKTAAGVVKFSNVAIGHGGDAGSVVAYVTSDTGLFSLPLRTVA